MRTMAGGFTGWLKKRKIVVLLLVFSFIVSGLIVNVLQLFSVPLYFFNKRWFRIVNAKLVYFHWCILPWAAQSWAEYDIRVFVNSEYMQYQNMEHALCVLNHRGDLDWMVGWCLIERVGMLGGTKAIMKDVAKYLPGIGWTFMFMEYPFLKRDWKKDEESLAASCRNLSDYPVNMLLCLFAEGTRFTKEKHERSVEFCQSRGLPVLKHHLYPRTKGFCCVLRNLKDTIPAIYDITICYREGEPSVMGIIDAQPCSVDILARRFPTSEIPTDSDEEMADWLVKLYQDKDKMVDYHMKHKCFPEELANIPKRILPDIIVFTWIFLLGVPVLLTAIYLAWVGAWFTLALIVSVVVLVDWLFQYIARHTNTAQTSSSYGMAPIKNGGKTTSNSSKKGQ